MFLGNDKAMLRLQQFPAATSNITLIAAQGSEQLSQPFHYSLRFCSSNEQLPQHEYVGSPCSFALCRQEPGETLSMVQQSYHGIIQSLRSLPQQEERVFGYELSLVPRFALLRLRRNRRIFQHQSSVDIVRQLCSEHGYTDLELQLQRPIRQREYTVQYDESDFDFVQRLLAQDGIFYSFRHAATQHILVLADSIAAYSDSGLHLPLERAGGDQQRLFSFSQHSSLSPGKVRVASYDPRKVDVNLSAEATLCEPSNRYAETTLSCYSDFLLHTDKQSGKQLAQSRLQAQRAMACSWHGSTNASNLSPGQVFSALNQQRQFVLVSSEWTASDTVLDSATSFERKIVCISHDVLYLPVVKEPPRAFGLQLAQVVGPQGEACHSEHNGCVQVQFYWDESCTQTCWLRVGRLWAGKQHGIFALPRVGDEVIVGFQDGNPDQPLILGSLPNSRNDGPYSQQQDRFSTGIRSHSIDGSADAYNELLFSDRPGQEQVLLQAQRDLHLTVKHDAKISIDGNLHSDIQGNHSLLVGKDTTVHIAGTASFEASKALAAKSLSLQLDAIKSITLQVGSASVLLDPARIVLTAPTIQLCGKVDLG